jgi:hypothetical protein
MSTYYSQVLTTSRSVLQYKGKQIWKFKLKEQSVKLTSSEKNMLRSKIECVACIFLLFVNFHGANFRLALLRFQITATI